MNERPEYAALAAHAQTIAPRHLRDLFAEQPERGNDFALSAMDIHMDYSKQRITPQTLALLQALLAASGFAQRRAAMFTGEHINVTEDRAVLHVALRAPRGAVIKTDGKDVVPEVHEVLDRMAAFSAKVRAGTWLGHTGKPIRNIVNIGIGGSDLGPQMADSALRHYAHPELTCRFVSNIDADDFVWKTQDLDPAQTLFIVCSKTFTTQETMTNAQTARDWLLKGLNLAGGAAANGAATARHFVAVSTNAKAVAEFGINTDNMFGFWDWVGGRYSMDSSVGLSTMLAIGPDAFHEMLGGFHEMDEHFRTAAPDRNMPVLMALLALWNADMLKIPTLAVLPYSQYLDKFSAYLQQLELESNGKHVTLDGSPVGVDTVPVLWGQPGTNGQHAFYQMIHQGTRAVACDFIVFAQPLHHLAPHQDMLLSNTLAQTQVMAFGQTADEVAKQGTPAHLVAHKVMKGNQPTTTLLCKRLTPRMLGRLVALYEHKVFTLGCMWGIDSFDQWGVELGKKMANIILPDLAPGAAPAKHDSSTNALISQYRGWRDAAV
jgi:glucose-6-phosphate isomerase